MIDLKAIRAAAEAATPGPWEAAGPSFGAPLPKYLNEVGRINEDEMFEEVCVSPWPEDDACSADMNYIATANPAAILELLDRLEAAEKDAARYRWIRAEHERYDPVCHLSWKQHLNRDCSYWVNTTSLDKDIDAARGEQK